MSADPVDTIVQALVQARRSACRTSAAALPALASADQAYAVQHGVAAALGWFGDDTPRHWKSGGASRDAVLTHAPLPPAGIWRSPAVAGDWPFHIRGIEAEVALRLAEPVDAARAMALDRDSAAQFIDAMAVSIEVVDSRWTEGLQAPALMRLADMQLHGALVLGEWVPFTRRDWADQRCRAVIGERAPVERRGTHSLGNPAWLLLDWLRHATRGGQVLPAGSVVTTGTWVGLLDAAAGERVRVEFDGIGEASVQL